MGTCRGGAACQFEMSFALEAKRLKTLLELRWRSIQMPWINKEMCTGCQTCVDECPVGAIFMENGTAVITDDGCIRCAHCHDICPEDAVRHDGERIPEEVKAHMAWVQNLLNHDYYAHDKDKQKQLIERLQRYFTKNIKVLEKTIEQLVFLKNSK